MDAPDLQRLARSWRQGLLEDVLPFWRRHAVDREHGGFLHCLDRDGAVLDTDKGMWVQARFTWLLAALFRRLEAREEWLELAWHGARFLGRHGFATEDRMWFQVTRDGRPLRRRRYFYTECFTVMAWAELAAAAGDEALAQRARALFHSVLRRVEEPGPGSTKIETATRPTKSLGVPMILLGVAQTLRESVGDPVAEDVASRCVEEIRRDFVHAELEAVLETVGPGGEVLEGFDGRLLNPGHALEAAWFLLAEARARGGDVEVETDALRILDWSWARGWDERDGGLHAFCDLDGRPLAQPGGETRYWWPHCEAILACLLAWRTSGEPRFAERLAEVHTWSHARFPDPEHGEWFGYLHADGRPATLVKGNLWKGPFHIPRMQLLASLEVEEGLGASGS